MRDVTAKRLSRLHSAVYRASRGAVGGRLVDNDMLLLTTRGRRTDRGHTVPLLYLRNGSDFVVFASWGGRDYHPDWYLNLLADPAGSVQVAGERIDISARTADATDRRAWWRRAVAAYPGYGGYQARTDREIPVVFLVARSHGAAADLV